MRGRHVLVVVCLLAACGALPAVASADETVLVCDVYGDHVAPQPPTVNGFVTSIRCPGNTPSGGLSGARPLGGMAIRTLSGKTVQQKHGLSWTINTPAGLRLTAVSIPHMYSQGVNDGGQWGGGLYWGGGGVDTIDGENSWNSHERRSPRFRWPTNGTTYFGWRIRCLSHHCTDGGHQALSVELLELRIREIGEPDLVASDGLWQAHGWIRGQWRLHVDANSPSGICALSTTLQGRPGPAHQSARNRTVWHQCAAAPIDQSVDTSQFGQGSLPLTITGTDAAGLSVTASRTIEVDNQRPTISLAGPTEASSAAGTQYIHASAAAGPSGVAGIACSLDNAPPHWYASATTAIAVHGVGVHHLNCYSENNAHDAAGQRGTSAPASWTLSIRSPSVSTLTFDQIGSALRCARRREQHRVPGRWSIQYRNGQKQRVWTPPRTEWIAVVHCQLRVVHRTVRRNGQWVTTTELALPRQVSRSRTRIPFGQPATVSGWLGAPDGTALADQPVRILTAPVDGALHFTQAAVARTSSTGIWTARLAAGPSRVVVAVYGGATTLEPSFSAPVHLAVPAGVTLHITPQQTHWGDTIRINGTVRGGYIPPKGEIVFLRVGWRGGSAEIGYVYTSPSGQFSTTYTFLRGRGTETYRFWANTGKESDYPYAPGRSNRVRVTVRQ
jgi:hypothetical protein